MNALTPNASRDAIHRFAISGSLLCIDTHERGHIHDTFISTWRDRGERVRFLHQRMNDRVFTDIPALMHNIERVTEHLFRKNGDAAFHTLQLVPTIDDSAYLLTDDGPWRTYRFIENTESYDSCRNPEQAFDAARAFGRFQEQLSDLNAAELRETIPHFFSSPYRRQQFDDALDLDPKRRAASAAREIEFVTERRDMLDVMAEKMRAGDIPTRIVHGDTKLNNVLFDREDGHAVCIVDLDTCMPAYSLYDFGDLVRFTAATSTEDERDLDRVGLDIGLYRCLVEGYLVGAKSFLSDSELQLMPFAARLVTLTIGLRFLTDYLAGDVYFKIDPNRPEHNLERARVQFAMVASMEAQEAEMAV